jgi:hypothetical protein
MRRTRIFTALVFAGLLVACGGDDGNPSGPSGQEAIGGGAESIDNVAACNAWLDSLEGCGDFDASTVIDCSTYDTLTACDITPYFDCLTQNFKCSDVGGTQVPDTSGWQQCLDKANCS